MKRKILITNDDGIGAGGIIRLAKAAQKFGEVWVVAPASQRSAASHSITLRDVIDVFPYDFPVVGIKAFACSGTPADCVRVGVRNIIPGKPDVVLSGINFGYNTATDLQYSATVGAALEGAFQGIPAIAFSEGTGEVCQTLTDTYLEQIIAEILEIEFGNDNTETACKVDKAESKDAPIEAKDRHVEAEDRHAEAMNRLAEAKDRHAEAKDRHAEAKEASTEAKEAQTKLSYGEIWNVNFPTCSVEEMKGIQWDRTVSRSSLFEDFYDETPIEGGMRYKVNGHYQELAEEGSDLRAIIDNYIAIGKVRNIGV